MPEPRQNVTVTGDHNRVVAALGDVYQIDLHLSESTPADRHNLLNLMERVRQRWVRNVLEDSVHRASLLELGMRAVPSMVDGPGALILEAVGHDNDVLPPGTPVTRVFQQVERTLLILGEPGAGKTTTLLTLARDLIEQAESDALAPIPVVLNLSSWARSRKPVYDWAVRELLRHYQTGRRFARQWLKDHRILLLLDGLDEVAEPYRTACVEALDAYVEKHGISGLVVCCRRTEYLALPVKLKMCGAIHLLPLAQEQIDGWFEAAGDTLAGLRAALESNPELRALAESPLMLNTMSVAFAGQPAETLRFDQSFTREALRDQIFAAYVEHMFRWRKRAHGGFPRAKTDGWLRWLATEMERRGETIFAIELLQPAWLTPPQLRRYAYLSRVAGGVVMAAVTGAVACLGVYLLAILVAAANRQELPPLGAATWVKVVLAYLAAAVTTGALIGLFYAPLDHRRLRRSEGKPPPDLSILRELTRFGGYTVLAITAVALVGVVALRGLGLSPQAPNAWVPMTTVLVPILSCPLFFAAKEGRGRVDGDIGLAGSVRWNWEAGRALGIIAVIASGIGVGWAGRSDLGRTTVIALGAAVTLVAFAYGSWRKEVPPVERWSSRVGIRALLERARVFAYAGLAWVAVAFPLTWALLPISPATALLVALLMAVVLMGPGIFWYGGLDAVLHASLRLVLARAGALPLRLRRFLDYGVHLGFLQRAGGGYIFIHGLLREHFAAGAPASAADGTP
ncbi:MAG TPA: NACHT domain-containing protein [Longimicrobium sp.]|nr:NACHT domain-containing protein [Longimicrobium sp.]